MFLHTRLNEKNEAAGDDTPLPVNCEDDPVAALKTMFVDMVMGRRIAGGQDPVQRPVFLKPHGVARGTFTIRPDLPGELRVGVFQYDTFPAWVRFSSDTLPSRPDLKTTLGIGIKLFGVPGRKLLEPEEEAATHDFLLQNHDVFFVDTARDMCEFTYAGVVGGDYGPYLKAHPKTQQILDDMQKVAASVLETDYWSVLPSSFGSDRYVKYKLEPCHPSNGDSAGSHPTEDPSYLHADLKQRLLAQDACFNFLVQLRTDPERMPLDQATVRWDEAVSAPIRVATLTFPRQDIDARGQATYGENLAYNPWHALPEHTPVGSIAAARRVVYHASARLRRDVNGQPVGEPSEVRAADNGPPARDTRIVRAAIYPGLGVARIGNSTAEGKDGYYIGPEVTEPALTTPGQHRDREGAIKRQAARFRIYGYNAAGEVVGEIGSDTAKVEWTVHLANKKAQWYQFQAALDIPEAAGMKVPRRNPEVKGDARRALAVDPGPRTIRGKNASGPEYRFDTGTFQGTPVDLGEVRTDEAGRLLVLGGFGRSHSPEGKPVFRPDDPNSFNNADGWFDDISDGPVSATVSLEGRAIPVGPAWVVVAPPNYAPDVVGWRTLYDLLVDLYVQSGWMALPETVSFTRDVLPTLRRLSNLQWVNKSFVPLFGSSGPLDFDAPALVGKLAHRPTVPDDPYRELRQQVYNAFRPVDNAINDPRAWPWIYGDAFGSFDNSPRSNLGLSAVRAQLLQRWVAGDFVSDWDPAVQPARTLEDVPLADRPAMLDQAALHFCLADAFHPGCEMTWPMRHASLYSAPFRIRHRPAGEPEPDYGDGLTQEIALQPGGPLYAQGPGDISRWMALPWQGDTAYCRSGYEPQYDPYLPTFWAARVPNQVLTEPDYAILVSTESTPEERVAAYNRREQWMRLFKGPVAAQMLRMIERFGEMGLLEARPGPENDPRFPSVVLVEGLPADVAETLRARVDEALPAARAERPGRLEEAGWESQEQLEEARQARGFGRLR